jgi:hypothetical protein
MMKIKVGNEKFTVMEPEDINWNGAYYLRSVYPERCIIKEEKTMNKAKMTGYMAIFDDKSHREIQPDTVRVVHKIASRLNHPVYVYGNVVNRWGFIQIQELVKKYE